VSKPKAGETTADGWHCSEGYFEDELHLIAWLEYSNSGDAGIIYVFQLPSGLWKWEIWDGVVNMPRGVEPTEERAKAVALAVVATMSRS
jgi:hypothetical protein